MIIRGTTDDSFIEKNWELQHVSEIKKLYDNNGKELADKYMWALYLTMSPQSLYWNQDFNIRREDVAKEYLLNPNFDWSILDDVAKVFPKYAMNKMEAIYYKNQVIYDRMMDKVTIEEFEMDASIKFLEKTNKLANEVEIMRKRAVESIAEEQEEYTMTQGQQGGLWAKKRSIQS